MLNWLQSITVLNILWLVVSVVPPHQEAEHSMVSLALVELGQQRKPAAFSVTIAGNHIADTLYITCLSLQIHHVHCPGRLGCLDYINEVPWPLVSATRYTYISLSFLHLGKEIFMFLASYLRGCHGLSELLYWRPHFYQEAFSLKLFSLVNPSHVPSVLGKKMASQWC